MTTLAPQRRLLKALFVLAHSSEIINIFTLSEHTGLSCYAVLKALNELAHHGLASARSMRLTLAGLALTVALHPELRRDVASASRHAPDDRSCALSIAPWLKAVA